MSDIGQERNTDEPVEEVDDEMIARRAYEISQSDDAGTSEENWERATRELHEGVGTMPEAPAS
jgi:hypothetical protein